MRWGGERESSNVEDRRDEGGGGGGGFGLPIGRGGIGLGTVAIALVAGWIFGINPLTILGLLSGGGDGSTPATQTAPQDASSGPRPAPQDTGAKFVSVVLASTEDTWTKVFQQGGAQYRPPHLVLYSGRTNTGCGTGEAAAGPFYCPQDQRVYIDLAFYKFMRDRLGVSGDTAQAYVIAHEVGHHIQNLLGTMKQFDAARARMSEQQLNPLSVKLELQADCYAGVWVFHSQEAKGWLDPGDIDKALNAAAAVGDDKIQKETQGVVVPERFTHGSSAQRAHWFKVGAQSGRMDQCDTFAARGP